MKNVLERMRLIHKCSIRSRDLSFNKVREAFGASDWLPMLVIETYGAYFIQACQEWQ